MKYAFYSGFWENDFEIGKNNRPSESQNQDPEGLEQSSLLFFELLQRHLNGFRRRDITMLGDHSGVLITV